MILGLVSMVVGSENDGRNFDSSSCDCDQCKECDNDLCKCDEQKPE
jgi:hypothetical protein